MTNEQSPSLEQVIASKRGAADATKVVVDALPKPPAPPVEEPQ